MNARIKKAREEFESGNYEKALGYLKRVKPNDNHYDLALVIKYSALMNLKRYSEAIKIINRLIGENPYDEYLWSRKVTCHYFNGEKEEAIKALGEYERVVDREDVEKLVSFAKTCNLLDKDDLALKYCNLALDIDDKSFEALIEKSMVAISMHDKELMNECADKIIDLNLEDSVKLMMPFTLKIFAHEYKSAFQLIDRFKEIDESFDEMLKVGIYNRMCDDLNIQLISLGELEIDIDETLDLMFDYYYGGVNQGIIKGVKYFIISE